MEHTLETIESGKSWACKFRVQTFIDEEGKPKDTSNLAPGQAVEGANPGFYEGVGVIQTRDAENKLVELYDQEQDRTWIVNWNDCWDIDSVDWVDAASS